MSHMIDHPLRQSSANELHARPFPTVAAPARAAFFAYKSADDETGRDEVADRTHLCRLLDMYDVAHPDDGCNPFFWPIRFGLGEMGMPHRICHLYGNS